RRGDRTVCRSRFGWLYHHRPKHSRCRPRALCRSRPRAISVIERGLMQLRTRLMLFGAALPLALLIATVVISGLAFNRTLLAEHDRALLGQAGVEAVSLFDRANNPHL